MRPYYAEHGTLAHTDVAPDRCMDDCIVPPDNAVDEIDKGADGNPSDVEDASHIPSCAHVN